MFKGLRSFIFKETLLYVYEGDFLNMYLTGSDLTSQYRE